MMQWTNSRVRESYDRIVRETSLTDKGIIKILSNAGIDGLNMDGSTLSRWKIDGLKTYRKFENEILNVFEQILQDSKYSRREKQDEKLKNFFFEKLKGCKAIIKSNLANDFLCKEEDLEKFLVSNPTLIFSLINHEYEYICDNGQNVPFVSKIHRFDASQQSETNTKIEISKTSKGFFLGHSLSPHSESICLLYELGRFKRISDLFGVKHNIYITDVGWAEFNKSVIEILKGSEDKKSNLSQCIFYREKLYSKLNIGYSKVKSQNQYEINNTFIDVKEQSVEYSKVSSFIEKSIKPNQKDEKDEKDILTFLKLLSSSDSFPTVVSKELTLLKYSIFRERKALSVIQTVLEHFKSLDYATFFYTLQQRFAQHQFCDGVKIAVESEQTFDDAFVKMEKVDENFEYNFSAIYYKHYYFKKENNELLNILPYTFPSGRLWYNAKKNTRDNIMESILIAENNTILLWDHTSELKQNKIRRLISEMDSWELAIQMSDLFSFCNYFFCEKDITFWGGLFNILDKIDGGECSASWKAYRSNVKILDDFCEKFTTLWYNDTSLPYFFYPFIYIEYYGFSQNKPDVSMLNSIRTIFSDLIIYILKNLHEQQEQNEWSIK